MKRAAPWVGLFALLGMAEAAARCPATFGERGGVWK